MIDFLFMQPYSLKYNVLILVIINRYIIKINKELN